jgi:hypothetical protein
MIRIFIGYDRPEPVVFNVAAHSLIAKSSEPLAITPINLQHLAGIFKRERNPLQSTEFSFSRFLVPYLAGYEGWAIFMDNDFLARADIAELWAMRDDQYSVMCVKHDHTPKEEMKFKGSTQTQYEKKNWSSLMLMNCAKCKVLTPEYVNSATGLELHQFKWLDGDEKIGGLPHYWNYLVDYYKHDEAAKLLHFTEGGPFYPDYANCDYADEWFAAFKEAGSGSQADIAAILANANKVRKAA